VIADILCWKSRTLAAGGVSAVNKTRVLKTLEKMGTAAASRIGKVEVDHGETGCKTPDAIPYIKKAAARKKRVKRRC
jgi:hypothetical protein